VPYKRDPAKKDAQRVLAAERPCAIAIDETSLYVVDALQIWRTAKSAAGKKEPPAKKIVEGAERLGCSIAIDKESVYWTIPGDDTLMRAKKADGGSPSALAFLKTRPTNVVVDGGYAYVITETAPRALGEMGSVFRVALRTAVGSEAGVPKALVVDQVGLNSIAAQGGTVVFSTYDQAENDGAVTSVTTDL
jgi:hypothetical protein